MQKSIITILVTGLVLGLGLTPLRAANARERLDDQAKEVNQQAKKVGMTVALQRISTETGVPLDQIEAMHKRHGRQGAADLLLASVLANETRKAPEDFLKRHVNGRSWAAIARDNNVPLDRLTERLDRLEKNMTSTSDNTSEKEPNKAGKRDKGAR